MVDAYAEHPDQINLSPYAYVGNNPIDKTDPDGNCPPCGVTGATSKGVQGVVGTSSENPATEGGGKAVKKWIVHNKKALLQTAKNFQELGSKTTKTGEALAIAGLPVDGVGAAPGLLLATGGGVESLSGDALKFIVDVVTADKKSATTDVVNGVKNEAIDYVSDKVAPGGSKLKDAAKVVTDYVSDKIKEGTDKIVEKKIVEKKK